jgi:hypothetical protein
MESNYIVKVENDEEVGRYQGYWPKAPFVIRRIKVETWKIKTIDRLQIINRYYARDPISREWVYMDEVVYKEQQIDPSTGKPIRTGGFNRGGRGRPAFTLSLVGVIDPEQIKLS